MCGIVGIWDYANKIEESVLEKMRDTLSHRGPDDSGLFIDYENNIGLGHRRLSIIDLSPSGRQPMSSSDENLQIVFNGEIYNFMELRKELEKKGHCFKTNTDTEVILKSYEHWGKKAVEKFRGMFAFAIFDRSARRIILCRDRAGVKPLYYYFDKNLFIFGSELKAIIAHPRVKKEINFDSLALFLKFGHVPGYFSIFKNINKLEAGFLLEIDNNKKITKEKYWDVEDFYLAGLEDIKNGKKFNEKQVEEELEKILIDSFKLRLVSDVPVGIFLSGGIDSSLVTALLSKSTDYPLKTFTIGFLEKGYDEAGYARKIAKHFKTEHHEMFCSAKEAIDVIVKIPEIYDEPFGDDSAIPTYLVSKFAKNYVKVALSADGGDELFCGYKHYRQVSDIFTKLNSVPDFLSPLIAFSFKPLKSHACAKLLSAITGHNNIQKKAGKLEKIFSKKNSLGQVLEIIESEWLDGEIKEMLSVDFSFPETSFMDTKRIKNLDPISQMQAMDFKNSLCSGILNKLDKSTMAVGLEGRDPFLDNNIIEYAAKLPLEYKLRKGQTKYILKKILKKHLPQELFLRPKTGFIPPSGVWFKNELKFLVNEYLDPIKIAREGIFDKKIIKKELKNYQLGKSNNFSKLWLILMFQMWKEKNMSWCK